MPCCWAGDDAAGLPVLYMRLLSNSAHALINIFPSLKTQIDVIVNAFNREVYGEVTMSGEGMKKALSAWRALRSPRHWPLRSKPASSVPAAKNIINEKSNIIFSVFTHLPC